MPNTLLTSSIISKELELQFENNLVMARNVDWQFNDKFGVSDAQIGASYRIRLPSLFTVTRNNLAYSAQNVIDKAVQLTVASSYTVPFSFTDADLALKVERFSERYVKQAVAVMAAQFDADIAAAVSNSFTGTNVDGATNATPNGGAWVVGTFATALTSDTLLLAKQYLLDAGCPDDGQVFGVLSPKANRIVGADQVRNMFNNQTAIGEVYKSGYIGTYAGIEWAVSQSLATHVNGAQTSLVVSAGDVTAWQETGTLTVTATTQAIKAGDVFTSTKYAVNPLTKAVTANLMQFTVTKDYAAGNTSIDVMPAPIVSGPDQNISGTVVGTLTLIDAANAQGQESIVFHKSAIAACSPKFEMPKKSSFDMAEMIDSDELRIRFLRGYDAIGASGAVGFISRLDAYFGVKIVRGSWTCRIRHS